MTQRPDGQGDGDDPAARPAAPPISPASMWQDWITIWQSELNALATDREAQEAWAKMVALWAGAARAAGTFLPDGAPGRPPGHPGAKPPPGPPPADAAPDARELALERLARRVEELERRLAGFLGGEERKP